MGRYSSWGMFGMVKAMSHVENLMNYARSAAIKMAISAVMGKTRQLTHFSSVKDPVLLSSSAIDSVKLMLNIQVLCVNIVLAITC